LAVKETIAHNVKQHSGQTQCQWQQTTANPVIVY